MSQLTTRRPLVGWLMMMPAALMTCSMAQAATTCQKNGSDFVCVGPTLPAKVQASKRMADGGWKWVSKTDSTTPPALIKPPAPQVAASVTTPRPRPEKRVAAASGPAAVANLSPPIRVTAEPAKKRECLGIQGFAQNLLCRIEGPETFWRCAPDGKNWNNNLAGCDRQTQGG
ncbi:MAG: hypothetical protein Q8O25_08270 [Sulfurisoma sp.]|nr:hypothetical protein [Sulfurisoma sp.]